MDRKVILGGILGAVLIFVFSFGLLLLFNQALLTLAAFTTNFMVSLVIFLLAPLAGGFIGGMIGKVNPHRVGLIAGTLAGVMLLAAFSFVSGFSLQTLSTGLVVLFVWVVLARTSAGFAKRH